MAAQQVSTPRRAALATLTLLALATLAAPAAATRYHSAKCVSLDRSCGSYFATRTAHCKASTPASAQPAACIAAACKWCALPAKQATHPCRSRALRARCGLPALQLAGGRYHSAKCVALGKGCGQFFASRSRVCGAGVESNAQSASCVELACRWCGLPGRGAAAPCTAPVLRALCALPKIAAAPASPPVAPPQTEPEAPSQTMPTGDAAGPAPAATPPMSPTMPTHTSGQQPQRAAGACTYEGDDQVVISLGDVIPAEGWTPVTRSGFNGLIYRKDWKLGLTPAEPQAKGEMCFPVRVQQAGDYFLTFVSYAAHKTEHNDAWITSSHVQRLWRTEAQTFFTEPAMKYLKAYTDRGPGVMSSVMKTGEGGGHRFTVTDVEAGSVFKLCVAGRSFKFEVFRLVLKKCFHNICMGGNLPQDVIFDMPLSRCV